MGKFLAIVWGISWRVAAFSLVVFAGLWWMNRQDGWDGRKAYQTQDAALNGRVGVAVVALAMPERYDPVFFENFLDKLFSGAIPWPINVFAGADAGTALIDPTNPMADTRFEPKELRDVWGRAADIDGVPWVVKYKKGEVRFVKPSGMTAHDYGFFLYPARKGGMRTLTAKLLLKARYTMYARLPNGYLPHYSQTIAMAQSTVDTLKARHNIAAGAVVNAFDPWQMETSVRSILDSGVDTIVLASVQPIYSDFEELRGSFTKVHKVIEAWQSEHPGKPVKVVIAPYMAKAPTYDDLWVEELTNGAPRAARPSVSSARVVLSLHGLPAGLVKTDSWGGFATALVARISPKLEAVMKAKGYGKVTVVRASEGFADPPEDKENVLVSVSEQFAAASAAGDEVVIALPLEFMAENTDMLFTHAAIMFEGLPGYNLYQGPPAEVDWRKPYARRFQKGQTTVIYAGAPGGDAAPKAGVVLADSVSTLWTATPTK
jgi:protoheme ferro-lyase